MLSQSNISPNSPMGATLLPGGGATFRTWAPRATAVYLNGVFGGTPQSAQTDAQLMSKDSNGYWTGFLPNAAEGDLYHFYVVGPTGLTGFKRDPYAREMALDSPFPTCSCVIRSATAYPWHDSAFITPDFSNMLIYQIHIGVYAINTPGVASTFLDVIGKIGYLADLGINVLQPLPIDEQESDPGEGYDGSDYLSPDFPYVATNPTALAGYLITVNRLLAAKNFTPLTLADITPAPAQLKCLIDLCHLYGIAVAFDVVYNHAGGWQNLNDDQAIYFFDRAAPISTPDDPFGHNESLYFTNAGGGYVGGLSFALWNQDVCQFIINSASYYINEFHIDGFRYDEISALLALNANTGWGFCANLTDTLRFIKPRLLQNAEYWPGEYSASRSSIVASTATGGAGFDAMQHDALRLAIRGAITQASQGQSAQINFDDIAGTLFPPDLPHAWQAVTCVENHDIVEKGNDQRIPTLADGSSSVSWYARSRSRVATALLLTAPGIPQLFMGQEFLEPAQWYWDPAQSNYLLDWSDLNAGLSGAAATAPNPALAAAMANHHRFTRDATRLRWTQPALRGEHLNAFHVHNQNRVIAFQRWLDGTGQDIIVVASLAETTWYNYAIGFPFSGPWQEIFNSDLYDNFPNPQVAGNNGAITADGPPLHGFNSSASITIPANGVVVFARPTQ
jgi:1,4-alpha-glucan branching enzyme